MVHHELAILTFVFRLATAALLGCAIGFERQWRQRSAGLHTSGLVATGSALFSLIQPALGLAGGDRVIANIVTGVGFLAGGVILRDGANVSGLNTAATIWATAAVGALAGIGLYREALVSTLVVIMLNLFLLPLVAKIDERKQHRHSES
ncbi:MAG: MgtC/SapB family protein [Candidatus Baltobacteraceae bacterium]